MKFIYRVAKFLGRAEWLRLGVRRRLVKFLAPPDEVEPAGFETSFRGGMYRGDIANMQEWHVYFFGGYELKELALIRDVLSAMDCPVALDVGANLGGHTLVMARHAAEVHSFEPYGPLCERIERQLALNGHERVTVHQVGLGEADSQMAYHLDTESRNQGTGSFLADHNEGGMVATLKVVRADDYLADRCNRIDFMKIDIEGFEASALAGLANTLKRTKPVIMMEITKSSQKQFEAKGGYAALIPFDYVLYRVENPTCLFGIVQHSDYRLAPLERIDAERNSYNVLIVPRSRQKALAPLLAHQTSHARA
ncbi:FkbM family methyltransferase [Qipengyuania sp. CAU 1752]